VCRQPNDAAAVGVTDVNDKALADGTRSVPATLNTLADGTRSVPATLNTLADGTRSVPATLNTSADGTRSVPATLARILTRSWQRREWQFSEGARGGGREARTQRLSRRTGIPACRGQTATTDKNVCPPVRHVSRETTRRRELPVSRETRRLKIGFARNGVGFCENEVRVLAGLERRLAGGLGRRESRVQVANTADKSAG
jgi:hypothetical protein